MERVENIYVVPPYFNVNDDGEKARSKKEIIEALSKHEVFAGSPVKVCNDNIEVVLGSQCYYIYPNDYIEICVTDCIGPILSTIPQSAYHKLVSLRNMAYTNQSINLFESITDVINIFRKTRMDNPLDKSDEECIDTVKSIMRIELLTHEACLGNLYVPENLISISFNTTENIDKKIRCLYKHTALKTIDDTDEYERVDINQYSSFLKFINPLMDFKDVTKTVRYFRIPRKVATTDKVLYPIQIV